LKHKLNDTLFYTLYGHLYVDSLTSLHVGKEVIKGETIAKLGNHEESGNYAPHLHFQIINDIGSFSGDYPGVSDKMNLDLMPIGYFTSN
jgi:murein DD-endopeptidase MepM/ murein hydrolase activator NlpD